MKFSLILILVAIANAKKCNDGISDVHGFISFLYDYIANLETIVRVQYNTYHGQRLAEISNQFSFIKILQNNFFTETCNYQLVEEGAGIYQAINEYFNVIKKNLYNGIKSSVDDLRDANLNVIYQFMQDHNIFADHIAELSTNMFDEGKLCVIHTEQDTKNFFDMSVRKLMEAIRSAGQTASLTVASVRTLRANLQASFGQIAHNSRAHFGGTQRGSTRQSNETVARNYNNVSENFYSKLLLLISYSCSI